MSELCSCKKRVRVASIPHTPAPTDADMSISLEGGASALAGIADARRRAPSAIVIPRRRAINARVIAFPLAQRAEIEEKRLPRWLRRRGRASARCLARPRRPWPSAAGPVCPCIPPFLACVCFTSSSSSQRSVSADLCSRLARSPGCRQLIESDGCASTRIAMQQRRTISAQLLRFHRCCRSGTTSKARSDR